MGYALHQRKVKIVAGPAEGGPLRELWAHSRRPFVAVFWHLRSRWLIHRGVTHARRWWNPPGTTVLVAVVALLTLALLAWTFVAVLDLIGKKWLVNDFGPQALCQEEGGKPSNNAAACDAVTGVAMPVLLVAASTLLFLSWRLWQVRRFCTYQARHEPSRLVQTAGSLMDEVVGRDQLCNAIMKNLGDKHVRRPHVVVGGVGVGKTALLVRLAQKLAAVGAVPIPIRLRDVQGETPLDFDEMALARFRDIVRSKVRSDGEIDRIWRWLRQRADRIVVLADGLEEAFSENGMSGRRDNLIRDAIRRAGQEGLPLVIASRPHEPLRAMQAAVSELEPLSNEAALCYIARSGSWRSDPTLLDRIVEAANMAESPIYLKIAKDLHSKDLLEPLWTGGGNPDLQLHDSWQLRAELMETWIHALVDGDVHPELPIDHDTRLAVVEYISALACIGLASDSADVKLGALTSDVPWNERAARKLDDRLADLRWSPKEYAHQPGAREQGEAHPCEGTPGGADWWIGPRVDVRIAATWGTRMGLVHEDGDKVRFQHSIVQAYLGSRFLDRMFENATADSPPEHIVGALRRGGRELLIALTLYSRSQNGKCVCGDSPAHKRACPVDTMCELLKKQAKNLLTDAERALRVAGQLPATGNGEPDERGGPRLRALEIYGAAVEIDSVRTAPRQHELISEISKDWNRLSQNEDPTRLREAKLALVKQCGTAVRRVAAAQSRNPEYEHPAYPPYSVLFGIGRKETDRRVREALVKEIGAGGEPAYQALCDRLSAACTALVTQRGCNGQEMKPSSEEADRNDRGSQRDLDEERERKERRYAEEEALAEKGKWACNTMRAWLLPLLVDSSMMSRHLASPRDDLENWVRVATAETTGETTKSKIRQDGPGAPISLGVALALGFKYAANRRPGSRPNQKAREFLVKQAQELLNQSTFWYTRLTLLHALTLWSLPDDVNADQPIRGHGADPGAQVKEWLSLGDKNRAEHPLVEAASKLAVRALQTRRPERFLWIDEAALASCIGTEVGLPGEQRAHNLWIPPSTGWSSLDPTAQQLLADVLLLMVLGERSHRPKDLFRILERCTREPAQMPSCLRKDRTRLNPVRGAERAAQPGSSCTDECRMKMCPYPAKVESLRMEFSEVFCLHQRDLLKKWQPWAWASLRFRREAPWQRKVPVAGMRRFWDQMSDRARDIDPDDTDSARTD
ncbi:NACHT domain-containing protein [Streptomyces sp. GQFP]|uniref:NACHT domain-containing protein n=1 Tax=Streptomyces sp. GQFP TaxID=2907545 RepID=UPI001F4193BA|nr:NACHT domain-containing protein [Streptomyces sp. GQFP]UIX33133.1 NACHT domain-containing protein [Streptomyces sp. GQFP]